MKEKKSLLPFVVFVSVLLLIIIMTIVLMHAIFPRKYSESVERYASEYHVPVSLVYSVIWCESKFDPEAVSSSDACGLMQLKQETYEEILGKMEIKETPDIFETDINIRCGVYYLRYLYELFGSWENAVAAYNAGLGNVNSWLSDPAYSDDGLTLKEIPIKETREYSERVFKIQRVYRIYE